MRSSGDSSNHDERKGFVNTNYWGCMVVLSFLFSSLKQLLIMLSQYLRTPFVSCYLFWHMLNFLASQLGPALLFQALSPSSPLKLTEKSIPQVCHVHSLSCAFAHGFASVWEVANSSSRPDQISFLMAMLQFPDRYFH